MLQVTDAQLSAWLVAFVLPLARILGVLATAPVFNNAALPVRMRLVLGLAISLALVPALPPMPALDPGSWTGMLALTEQSLIGVAIGFAMRVVFVAVDVAGELIGLQMGLSFAVFYDPQSANQSPVVAEFLGMLVLLMFMALNGHLMVLALLAESFNWLPVGGPVFAAQGWHGLLRWSGTIFSAGALLALPAIGALLVTNIALGVLTRAAPQLNLFAVGFPVTLIGGFVVLALTMPLFGPAMERLFEQGLNAVTTLIGAGAPR